MIFFGLTVLKNFVGNAFNLPELFGYRNFLCMRTKNQPLQSNFFVPQYAKISRKPLLSFRNFGISKTFMHITVSFDFFCLTVPKNFLRNHLKFQNVSNVRCRKVLCKRTEYHDFPSKFFCLGAEKFRWGTLRYIRKVRLTKNFMTKRLITLFSVEFFFTYTASKVRW